MTPQQALEKQIELLRAMTPLQRLEIGFQLNELAREKARQEIRRQHPEADEAEVNRLLREQRLLANLLHPT